MKVTQQNLVEVVDLLFGDAGDELIRKMNPTQSDLATKDRKKRVFTAGLSAVGAGAGAAGLALGAKNLGGAYKTERAAQRVAHGFHAPGARRAALKHAAGKEKFATGLIPLEVAGLGGELMATKILHGDTKKKKPGSLVKKDIKEIPEFSSVPSKGQLTRSVAITGAAKGVETIKANKGRLLALPNKVKTTRVRKNEYDVTWQGEFAKVNADKQQVFGWASIVELHGEPVVDLQGDYISIEEIEKSAYEFVHKSRKGGDMHLRDDWSPVQKSDMIESFIVTEEKRGAMGLPDSVPTGWWVGFQVQDPNVWAKVRSGERTGFSIHGHGKRTPTDG